MSTTVGTKLADWQVVIRTRDAVAQFGTPLASRWRELVTGWQDPWALLDSEVVQSFLLASRVANEIPEAINQQLVDLVEEVRVLAAAMAARLRLYGALRRLCKGPGRLYMTSSGNLPLDLELDTDLWQVAALSPDSAASDECIRRAVAALSRARKGLLDTTMLRRARAKLGADRLGLRGWLAHHLVVVECWLLSAGGEHRAAAAALAEEPGLSPHWLDALIRPERYTEDSLRALTQASWNNRQLTQRLTTSAGTDDQQTSDAAQWWQADYFGWTVARRGVIDPEVIGASPPAILTGGSVLAGGLSTD